MDDRTFYLAASGQQLPLTEASLFYKELIHEFVTLEGDDPRQTEIAKQELVTFIETLMRDKQAKPDQNNLLWVETMSPPGSGSTSLITSIYEGLEPVQKSYSLLNNYDEHGPLWALSAYRQRIADIKSRYKGDAYASEEAAAERRAARDYVRDATQVVQNITHALGRLKGLDMYVDTTGSSGRTLQSYQERREEGYHLEKLISFVDIGTSINRIMARDKAIHLGPEVIEKRVAVVKNMPLSIQDTLDAKEDLTLFSTHETGKWHAALSIESGRVYYDADMLKHIDDSITSDMAFFEQPNQFDAVKPEDIADVLQAYERLRVYHTELTHDARLLSGPTISAQSRPTPSPA